MKNTYRLLNQLNKETQIHSQHVADYARMVAKEVGLNETELWTMGALHDVGKLYIPSRILKKATNLTDIERKIVDLHSYISYIMIKGAGYPEDIAMVALYHHGENKHKLEDVPELTDYQRRCAKIISTIDCYDAVTSKRVYHKPVSDEKAKKILESLPFYSKEAAEVLLFQKKKSNTA